MKRLLSSLVVSSALLSAASFANNSIQTSTTDSIVEAGDLLQILVPATGYFATWMHGDWQGAEQLTYSILTTGAIVHGGKFIVSRNRPNNSNWSSFPSGHTASAFSGASFLQSRYGAKWGIPAYAAATFVGISRIHGNKHYAGDVTAGATIAFLVNQYFVSPYRMDGVMFNAQSTGDGAYLDVTVQNDAFDNKTENKVTTREDKKRLRHRIELGIGSNLNDSASQAGADQYLSGSEPVDKYQPFAYVKYQYQMLNNNLYELEFSPNETRRYGTVSEEFTIDGETFGVGDEVFTAYRHWLLGTSLYKGLQVTDELDINLGLGFYVHRFGFDVAEEDGDKEGSIEHWRAMPSFTVKADYDLTTDWSALAEVQYQYWENDSFLYAETGVNYRINKAWDVGFKYGFASTQLDNKSLATDYKSNLFMLTFANRF